jgi:excisionase family DNA binding protein
MNPPEVSAEAGEIVIRVRLEHPAGEAREPAPADPQAYRVETVAELLDVGKPAIYDAIMTGELESMKIGASRRIPRAALERYVARLTRTETPGSAA